MPINITGSPGVLKKVWNGKVPGLICSLTINFCRLDREGDRDDGEGDRAAQHEARGSEFNLFKKKEKCNPLTWCSMMCS